jgi:hypothetical protein
MRLAVVRLVRLLLAPLCALDALRPLPRLPPAGAAAGSRDSRKHEKFARDSFSAAMATARQHIVMPSARLSLLSASMPGLFGTSACM